MPASGAIGRRAPRFLVPSASVPTALAENPLERGDADGSHTDGLPAAVLELSMPDPHARPAYWIVYLTVLVGVGLSAFLSLSP
jgi:hypothetical protein